jgi:DNA-binding Lrp family transcriptional regulator
MPDESTEAIITVPFSWQDKRILKLIRRSFDGENVVATALAAYHGLTEIASDHQQDEFKTTIHHIAHRAGLSQRTTRRRIADLAGAGVITVTTPKLKSPSTYKLLPFDPDCPMTSTGCRAISNRLTTIGHSDPTIGHSDPTIGHSDLAIGQREGLAVAATRRIVRIELPLSKEKIQPPTLEQVKLESAKIGLPDAEAEKFINHYTSNGWKVGQNAMESWRHSLINWKARWQENSNQNRNAINRNFNKPNPRNAGLATNPSEQGKLLAAAVAARDSKHLPH